MTDLTGTKKVLTEMVERYEDMLAEYLAIRQVMAESPQVASLLTKYSELLVQTDFRNRVHAHFLPLYAGISAATQESDVLALIQQIPGAQKER